MENKFNLGDKVKDPVLGVEGSIENIHYHLTGCTRYGIHVAGKDEIYWASIEAELVTKSKDEIRLLPFAYPLGSIVRDRVTGAKLVVIRHIVFREGYNRYYCRLCTIKNGEHLKDMLSYEEAELEAWLPWYKRIFKRTSAQLKAQEVVEQTKKINPSPVGDTRGVSKE